MGPRGHLGGARQQRHASLLRRAGRGHHRVAARADRAPRERGAAQRSGGELARPDHRARPRRHDPVDLALRSGHPRLHPGGPRRNQLRRPGSRRRLRCRSRRPGCRDPRRGPVDRPGTRRREERRGPHARRQGVSRIRPCGKPDVPRHELARRHRTDIARRAAAAVAEDGGDREARRRRCPRLQQPPHRDQRLFRHGARVAAPGGEPTSGTASKRSGAQASGRQS